jgi:hypothetical protein
MLTRLIYHSEYVRGDHGALTTVRNIIRVSEINNARDRITGFLIFDKAHFLQILEGNAPDVAHTLQRIQADSRHRNLTIIEDKAVAERTFGDWAMGGFVRSPEAESIYSRHGIADALQTALLTAEGVLALAQDLLALENKRQKERVVGLSTHDPV